MITRRLGKFKFRDYYTSWASMVVLLLFSAASIVLELSFFFAFFPLVYVVVWLGTILFPYREKFAISDDSISVFGVRKNKNLHLPTELMLIVSYVDVCPPLAVRTVGGSQTHVLRDKFAVSILQKMPVTVALETLHQNGIQEYTTSRIRVIFDEHQYIYSFVCNQFLFNELVANRKCSLIVPESLAEAISFESSHVRVYIDKCCNRKTGDGS